MAPSYMYEACKIALFPTSPQKLPSPCSGRHAVRSAVAFFELLCCMTQLR